MTLPTSTYQEQAFNFIKMGILTRSYKPGEYITDKQIADSMNISRTPVREAFHRLANEGLLINRGPSRMAGLLSFTRRYPRDFRYKNRLRGYVSG